MQKILIALILTLGLGLFAAVRWGQAMNSDGHSNGSHEGGGYEGGHSGDVGGAMTPEDEAYQKAMDQARKLNEEKKAKEAEDAVNKALVYKPNDPAATALKARITRKIKNMTYVTTNEQGLQEYKHAKTGMIFVLIPGGVLVIEEDDKSASDEGMGNGGGVDDDAVKDKDKKKQRELKIDDFLMSKYETPQGVWINFMNGNPSFFKKGNDYPVEQVTWENVQSFCKKTDLRLPGWVEWEYACRAGSGSNPYFWGKEPNDDYVWYSRNSAAATHLIASKKANGFGLHNMLGNVMEWCNEQFKDRLAGQVDPIEPGNKEKYGMLRGGAWDQQIELCQSASYIQELLTYKSKNAGFRCARDINKP